MMYLQTVFWQEFHESRGDKQICLSSWNRHSALGHVRELRFVSPVKVNIAFQTSTFTIVIGIVGSTATTAAATAGAIVVSAAAFSTQQDFID